MKTVILIASLVHAMAGKAWAQWRGDDWGMGPWMMGWGIVGWIVPVMMVLFWAAILVAIIIFLRWAFKSGLFDSSGKKEESALDILKKRYARGEISKEEFEDKKRDIL